MAQDLLRNAKKSKNDEFYTQYEDIEKEVNEYYEYNKDVFKNKTILLPCDDPEWSNFTKYFAANFDRFGLNKLISTSYVHSAGSKQLSLFEKNSDEYDPEKHDTKGKIFVLDRDNDNSGRVDIADLKFHYLEGDGDYRSKEVTKLRDEADIIITNPPFSMFRDFLNWILEANKKFLIIGNINCISYREVFLRIRDNKIWLGTGMGRWISGFIVPKSYKLYGSEAKINSKGQRIVATNNCLWLTNLEHGKRHQKLELMTMEDNLRYNTKLKNRLKKKLNSNKYLKYDNYDALDVPFTEAIPSDYDGKMGVPMTFLDKYNPEQFKIIGGFNGSNLENKVKDGYVPSTDTPYIDKKTKKIKYWNGPTINKKTQYYRIIIQKKQVKNDED